LLTRQRTKMFVNEIFNAIYDRELAP